MFLFIILLRYSLSRKGGAEFKADKNGLEKLGGMWLRLLRLCCYQCSIRGRGYVAYYQLLCQSFPGREWLYHRAVHGVSHPQGTFYCIGFIASASNRRLG